MARQKKDKTVDDLIIESQRLRDELMKTVGRLDAFIMQLDVEVDRLSQVTGEPDERIPAREAPPSTAGGRPPRETRSGTDDRADGGQS